MSGSGGYDAGAEKTLHHVLHGHEDLNKAVQVEETTTLFQREPEELALSRDVVIENSNGTVAFDPAFESSDVIGVQTDGVTNGSEAVVETTNIIDYRSGHKVEGGIRVLLPSPPEEGVAEWGVGDNAAPVKERIYWSQVPDGTVSANVQREGNVTSLPETEWGNTEIREVPNENGDVEFVAAGLDPFAPDNGLLGETIDTSIGFIYKIGYTWYGQGAIIFYILTAVDAGVKGMAQKRVPCVAFAPKGNTSITNPNQPLFARASDEGTAGTVQLGVAGRQAWVAGRRGGNKRPIRHIIDSPPEVSGTSYTTVLLARRKPAFRGNPADIVNVSVSGGGVYDVEVRGRVDATNPTWSDPNRDTEDPIPIEVDESTAVDTVGGELTGYPSGGDIVDASTQGSQIDVSSISDQTVALVRNEPAAIVMRDVSGTASTPSTIAVNFSSAT